METLATADLEQQIIHLATNTVLWASIILIVCTIVALLTAKRQKKLFKRLKLPLFLLMAVALVGSTITLFAGTVYLNVKSESKGPVHWHADIEFWACGSEVELRDPHGLLSNKIGTATFHEHNDKRIHLEGVVVKKSEDASLTKFMRVTGGYITHNSIGIPLNEQRSGWTSSTAHQDGDNSQPSKFVMVENYVAKSDDGPVLELNNNKKCGTTAAAVQTFVISYDEATKTTSQTKLADPASYIMRDQSQVPPGDCVIVEFDAPKDRTDKLCEQYGVRDATRCESFGVKKYTPEQCYIRPSNTSGSM